ncbi:MAG: ArsA family ATPase [Actinobacteria bacterium]|nr:ArsA family ATPase [Actinomycetota bacterium]MBW3641756.1 ArsA family ATPase [Actinomycetota bacterium]
MVGVLDRRLLFVTGKGGVGKTTVAAALGLLAAREGRRTLMCEVDAKGDLTAAFEAGEVGFSPRELEPRLFAMTMDTEESLKEYLALQLHLPRLARLGPLARTFDFLANAAPGVKEVLTVGKLAWEVRERHYDLVVVDAAASGHVVGQLRAPQAINELLSVGLVREQTDWMMELLNDPATTGVVIVAAPEEMPVTESLELVDQLASTGVDLAAVVVNRVLPELFGRGEEEVFARLVEPAASAALSAALRRPVHRVLDAARLAMTLRRTRAAHLSRLRQGLGPERTVLYVPELFTRSHGRRATVQVTEALAAELS